MKSKARLVLRRVVTAMILIGSVPGAHARPNGELGANCTSCHPSNCSTPPAVLPATLPDISLSQSVFSVTIPEGRQLGAQIPFTITNAGGLRLQYRLSNATPAQTFLVIDSSDEEGGTTTGPTAGQSRFVNYTLNTAALPVSQEPHSARIQIKNPPNPPLPGFDIDPFKGTPRVKNFDIDITVIPPADITVNTLDDEINADGDCSLREAITSANNDTATIFTDACAIGSGADSIGFSVAGTVVLNSVLPVITSPVDIIGPVGDPIIISGGGAVQLFVVGSGGLLRLDALTLSGGLASDGGAIINNLGGTLTVFNSTFSGNRAQQSGGAIRNLGVATIVNSTFASNSAAVSGGALADSGVGMTLTNCTIAANAALGGGGIATEQQGAVTLRNTLFGNNAGGNCLPLDSGTITDGGGNLDDGASCGFTDNTSLSDASAGLDPLGLRDNGGPTQTIALVADSQAIDRGIEAICSGADTVKGRDQRGEPRPRDGDADGDARCDIGAFELNPRTCRGRVANVSVSNNTILGGPGSGTPYTGTLRGTNGNDVIVGTDANDAINGARGNDTICGGAGRDTLRGAQGHDRLFGERGRDRLFGGSGRDLCNGGQGRDRAISCERLKSIEEHNGGPHHHHLGDGPQDPERSE